MVARLKGLGLQITLLGLLFFSVSASASKDVYTGWFSNTAVSGYDSVAYFTESKAVKGSAKFKFKYKGAEWHFISEKHLKMFQQSPEKYSPQYGGYCAWAVAARKQRAPGDPNYWKIVDDRLYLNYDAEIQKKWLQDITGFIKKANENWPEMTAR